MSAGDPDRRRYRVWTVRAYGDAKFRGLGRIAPCPASLYMRLCLNEEGRAYPGLLRTFRAGLADALGWSLAEFDASWGPIEASGMAVADWVAGLVFVPNTEKHNRPESPSVCVAWGRSFADLPDSPLTGRAIVSAYGDLSTHFAPGWAAEFVRGLPESLRAGCAEPAGQAPETLPAGCGQAGRQVSETCPASVPVPVPVPVKTHTPLRGAGGRGSRIAQEAQEWFESVFWPTYPRKRSKAKALRAAGLLGAVDRVAATKDLVEHKRAERDPEWVRGAIPYPATYLNGRAWEDDWQREAAAAKNGGAAGPGRRGKLSARVRDLMAEGS